MEGETLRVTVLLTVRLAEAVLPVPPLVELTAPEVLVNVPPDVPVTFKEIAQLAPVASEPPLSEMLVVPADAVAVPAQVEVSPLGVDTIKPEGSVSVSATPDSANVLAAGFVMVKLKLVLVSTGIVDAPKPSAIVGGATTAMLTEALPPVPPSVEVTLPLVLLIAPAVVPVTFNENVHEEFVVRLAPLRFTRLVACVAVIAPAPQLPTRPLGVEMVNPAGSVSLNATPLSPTGLAAGLVMVKLSVVESFSGTLAAPKDSPIVGGAATARLAVAVLPDPPLLELTVTLLFFAPAVVPVTFKLIVQEAPAANVPAERLTTDEPVAAVAVPVQFVVKLLGVATTKPVGKLSLNPTPVSDTVFAAGLVIVKASEVVPFTAMLGAPNDSAMVGGAAELGVGLGLGVGSGVGVGPGPALPPPPPHAVRLTARQPASIAAQKLPATLRQPSHFIRLHNPSPGSVSATIGTRLACCVTQQPNWN